MHYFKLLVAASLFAAPQMQGMCKVNLKSFSAHVTAKPQWLACGAAAMCAYYAYKNYNTWDSMLETAHRDTLTANSVDQIGEDTKSKELNARAKALEKHAPEYQRKAQLYTLATFGFCIVVLYLGYKK